MCVCVWWKVGERERGTIFEIGQSVEQTALIQITAIISTLVTNYTHHCETEGNCDIHTHILNHQTHMHSLDQASIG